MSSKDLKSLAIECFYYDQNICRSCDLLNQSYEEQISFKEKGLKNRFPSFSSLNLLSTERSTLDSFRNKAKLSVSGTTEDPILGLLGETKDSQILLQHLSKKKRLEIQLNALSKGRELLQCPVHHPDLNELFIEIKKLISIFKIEPYQIQHYSGELKGLIAFRAPDSLGGEMSLRFIARSKAILPKLEKIVPVLQEKFKKLKVITLNIQPISHAFLEGKEELFLTPEQNIHLDFNHSFFKGSLTFSPKAFIQTNLEIAVKLYEEAALWVKECTTLLKKESSKSIEFYELYCGTGLFTFFSHSFVDKAFGFEVNSAAVQSGNETAKQLGFQNVEFKASDCEKMESFKKTEGLKILLVNPPRKGCGESVHLLLDVLPEYIIYSSCESETLAKDIQKLVKKYSIKKMKIFDLFPHTKHFETLVLLRRND